jgi:RES domain-containing protein
MVYASQSVALATLELLVHLRDTSILEHYVVFEINFDDDLISTVEQKDLPREWRDDPPPLHLQQIGDDWARDRTSAVLCVPSAVIPEERNYLLNPEHPRFRDVGIGAPTRHRFDERLLR